MSTENDFSGLDKKVDVLATRVTAGFAALGKQIEGLIHALNQGHGRLRDDIATHVNEDTVQLRELNSAKNELEKKVAVLQTKVNLLMPLVGVQGAAIIAGGAKYAGIFGGG